MSGSTSMYSLAGVAVVGVSTAAATLARRERTYMPRGHASRIDTCRDPLGRALRFGCAGLTLGVTVGPDGRLRLAEGDGTPARIGGPAARDGAPVAEPAVRDGTPTALDVTPGARAGGPAVRDDASGVRDRAPEPRLRAAAPSPGPAVATAEPPARPGDRDRDRDRDRGRALRRLVLDPLQARVRIKGRVYAAAHQPFSVVLEPADGVPPARVLDALEDELADYAEMLTRCVAGTIRHAAVLVALAGAPRGTLSARESRLFFAEGSLADVDRRVPTSVVPLVGEHVAWTLGWDGRAEMPGEERHLLRALIATAHAEGKRVRLFGVPERRRPVRRAFWRELHAAGADLIAARDVAALRRFLRAQRAHRCAHAER